MCPLVSQVTRRGSQCAVPSLSVTELKEFLSWLFLLFNTNFRCFIDNLIPDDTKEYQTKSYREKVKLKAGSCSAVIIKLRLVSRLGGLVSCRVNLCRTSILLVSRRQYSHCLAQEY